MGSRDSTNPGVDVMPIVATAAIAITNTAGRVVTKARQAAER